MKRLLAGFILVSVTAAVTLAVDPNSNGIKHFTVQDWKWADNLCDDHGGAQHFLRPENTDRDGIMVVCGDGKVVR